MALPVHRIASQFYNRPLLLTPQAADTISGVLLARLGDRSMQLGGGSGGEDTAQTSTTLFPAQAGPGGTVTVHTPQASRFYGEVARTEDGAPMPFRRTQDGVAIITLVGEWVNRGGYVGASSGVISYEGFKYQLEVASQDPRTRAVLLDMESPGGEAVGAFEAAAAVRQLAAIKPVWAMVNGLAASAAYAIASAATRIVSMPTGISGSIGVVLAHFDYSEMLAKEGIKPTFIHAGANKVDANPYQALPVAVRDRLQAEVNTFYELFVETVAAGRPGLTAKAIRDTQAGTFMGAEALELGLIDALGTFEGALAELTSTGPGTGRTTQGSSTNMTPQQNAVALAALATAGGAPAAAGNTALPAASHSQPQAEVLVWDDIVAGLNSTLPSAATTHQGPADAGQEPETVAASADFWGEIVAAENTRHGVNQGGSR